MHLKRWQLRITDLGKEAEEEQSMGIDPVPMHHKDRMLGFAGPPSLRPGAGPPGVEAATGSRHLSTQHGTWGGAQANQEPGLGCRSQGGKGSDFSEGTRVPRVPGTAVPGQHPGCGLRELDPAGMMAPV